jgi:hypothetical protein
VNVDLNDNLSCIADARAFSSRARFSRDAYEGGALAALSDPDQQSATA